MKTKKIGLALACALLATSVFAQAAKQPEIKAMENTEYFKLTIDNRCLLYYN